MILSKIDVAKSQLETAIKLYFLEEDPISIHTLASASEEILMKLLNQKGGTSILRQDMLSIIRPEKHKEFIGILQKTKNFFKHADRDLNDSIDFNIRQNDFILRNSGRMYQELGVSDSHLINLFDTWFMCNNPDNFLDLKKEFLIGINRMKELGGLNKKDFFETAMQSK